jgi:hypothetical protein
MLRWLWSVFVFSLYSSAIAWILFSKIVEKLTKKDYSFRVDIVIFLCFFVIFAIIIAMLLY